MTAVSMGEMYLGYKRQFDSELDSSLRIWAGLNCARAFTDDALLRHANQYGLFDISKVGCSEKKFLASLQEVRNATEPKIPDLDYRRYVNPIRAASAGAIWMAIVAVGGMLLIVVRRIANWVIGA